ncbi:oligopeptide ABC transporter substrate-binding protein [Bacillus massiliigorillae]|uniref:oligopeptide ABC transporter substrate-binding protein n=1 Tax=Bacillus massiliigorillae TaxID=1243664 RepID=UPI00039CB354|nr:oligopeptide ABC transporter substrate-binding protein [Bacillus massiliigorillae]
MRSKKWSIVGILVVLTLLLSACVGTKKSEQVSKEVKEEGGGIKETSFMSFPMQTDNKDKAIKGGTLNVALVTDSPFQGVFSDTLSEDNYDQEIQYYMGNYIFETDGDFLVKDGGIASLNVDTKNKKATIKIKDGVKWSDGEPLKIEDLMYPYLIIGHKDYTGVRYDAEKQNIVGMTEYHDGKAESISGLKKVDDRTLEISLKKITPGIFTGQGDGLVNYAEPYHYLKDVPVKDLIKSNKIRKAPLSLGAFKLERIVNGESVQLIANEYYFKGKPKIDKVVIKVVPSSSSVAALKAGEYDIALSMPTDIYQTYKDIDNVTNLGRPEMSYTYLGFNLGKYDKTKTLSIMDDHAKTNDVQLRQAIAYALNVEELNKQFYDGLRTRANSINPPVYKSFYAESIEGYKYNPDKANKLLDEAGYKDINGDGIREGKDGKPFELKFAFMAGGENDTAMAQFYIQNWQDVGLKVSLTTGRPIEFNSFYDKVQANDKDIDLFVAAWATDNNPSPSEVYSKEAEYNLTRFTSPKMDKLIADIDSEKSVESQKHRNDAFLAWEKYMEAQLPVVPLQFRTQIVPVNKRVKGVDMEYGIYHYNYQNWELTAEKAVKASK